jgi:hypothetical protein
MRAPPGSSSLFDTAKLVANLGENIEIAPSAWTKTRGTLGCPKKRNQLGMAVTRPRGREPER